MLSERWTTNDGAQPGQILMALDWTDREGDPVAVIVDLGEGVSPHRYVAREFCGRELAQGSDLAALTQRVEQLVPAL